jgi:hypothetical protein
MVLLLFFALQAAAPARAQAGPLPRVRASSPYLRLLIASGIERSPTFREIVERLEESDLIVEVECGRFSGTTLAGRTVLLAAMADVRYVLTEVACPATSVPALSTVGHELRHALEIASARWVVDGETLALLYTQIGYQNRGAKSASYGQFETADALDAGERVHHELFHPPELSRGLAQVITK